LGNGKNKESDSCNSKGFPETLHQSDGGRLSVKLFGGLLLWILCLALLFERSPSSTFSVVLSFFEKTISIFLILGASAYL
jgi:hypothetical protein